MFKAILEYVRYIFGIKTSTTQTQYANNNKYASDYRDIRNINFTSIFANKFASLVKNESEILVTDEYDTPSKRTEMLNNVVNKVFGQKGKKMVSRMCGTGGVVLLPFVARNKIYVDMIPQDRLVVNEKIGDEIYSATVLAEIIERENLKYYRWTNYRLDEDNNYHIVSTASTEREPIALKSVPEWKEINPHIVIPNCDKVLFAFMKCPTDNRTDNDTYGVPLTYGCEKTIKEIYECLDQIAKEFRLKEAFVGMDDRLFGKDGQLSTNNLFRKFRSGSNDADFWEIFDPAIRDSSYYNRLLNLYESLEKQIGSSKGVLTEPVTDYATATEVKRGNYDTYAIVADIRQEIERGFEDFVYACNVLIDYYNLAPMSDYKLVFNWSYSLIENSSETWTQYSQAVGMGVMKKAEARQYLISDESYEESERIIKEIEKEQEEKQFKEAEMQQKFSIENQANSKEEAGKEKENGKDSKSKSES